MPRRRRTSITPRTALSSLELETKILGPLRGLKVCAKLKGIRFVYVGSLGQEPNWFAQPIPSSVSGSCRRLFVSALASVRKEFDMLPAQRAELGAAAFGLRPNPPTEEVPLMDIKRGGSATSLKEPAA